FGNRFVVIDQIPFTDFLFLPIKLVLVCKGHSVAVNLAIQLVGALLSLGIFRILWRTFSDGSSFSGFRFSPMFFDFHGFFFFDFSGVLVAAQSQKDRMP